MKALKAYLRWAIINGIFAGLLIAGLSYGIEGAKNVGLLLVWMGAAISPFLLSKDAVDLYNIKKIVVVNRWLDHIFDTLVVAYLVWNSYFISGIAYGLALLFIIVFRGRLDESRKKGVECYKAWVERELQEIKERKEATEQ